MRRSIVHMPDQNLEADVAAYISSPTSGERLPSTHALSIGLVGLLHRMAAERGVPVDALVEFMLFKQIKADQARRMVESPLEPVPASFSSDAVARARVELEKDAAAIKGSQEERGDKASRIAAEMQAVLDDAQGVDSELDTVRRRTALDDATLDIALEKHSKND